MFRRTGKWCNHLINNYPVNNEFWKKYLGLEKDRIIYTGEIKFDFLQKKLCRSSMFVTKHMFLFGAVDYGRRGPGRLFKVKGDLSETLKILEDAAGGEKGMQKRIKEKERAQKRAHQKQELKRAENERAERIFRKRKAEFHEDLLRELNNGGKKQYTIQDALKMISRNKYF